MNSTVAEVLEHDRTEAFPNLWHDLAEAVGHGLAYTSKGRPQYAHDFTGRCACGHPVTQSVLGMELIDKAQWDAHAATFVYAELVEQGLLSAEAAQVIPALVEEGGDLAWPDLFTAAEGISAKPA